MRAWLVVVAACGPGFTAGSKATARDALSGGDYARLVRGDVTNGGLWFEDASCAAKFGAPGKIAKPDLGAFAHCLAGLHLQASAREDALGDVVVMTYAPGIEVEARVVFEDAGPRLAWIGYEGRRSDADNLPTVSSEALEALRVDGDRDGPLDPSVAGMLETNAAGSAFTWFKFCVDESGAVTEMQPFETTSVALRDAFGKALLAWHFKPFAIAGTPVPVCSMARLEYPPRSAPRPEVLPLAVPPPGKDPIVFLAPLALEGHRLAGVKNIVPDDDTKIRITRSGRTTLRGVFRMCLDVTGHVESILPAQSTGSSAYDRRIISAIKGWVYKPYTVGDQPVRVCTAITFIYHQAGH